MPALPDALRKDIKRYSSKRRPPSDADRCLLSDDALLALSNPDAAGYLHRRSNISGWYRYWFSLHGSQLLYFERAQFNRRGLLVGTVSLFRHKLTIVNSFKRRGEFEITDLAGKQHIFRADSDAELHWWVEIFDEARNKIPPARPIAQPSVSSSSSSLASSASTAQTPNNLGSSTTSLSVTNPSSYYSSFTNAVSAATPPSLEKAKGAKRRSRRSIFSSDEPGVSTPKQVKAPPSFRNIMVDPHKQVDHVLCIVHGIGVHTDTLSTNVNILHESYLEIMAKIFPDFDFGVELLVVHWRDALMGLDMHQKLRAVVPRVPSFSTASSYTSSVNNNSTAPSSANVPTPLNRDITSPSPTSALGYNLNNTVTTSDERDDGNPLKHIMEHTVVDYVYYTNDRYRQHILREVCQQLNEAVREFRLRRPEFTGKISVMGHSLGAALSYDLLSKCVDDDQVLLRSERLRLEFDVDNLFCLGSPLGTLLAMDPYLGGKQAGRSLIDMPFNIINVFKYQDPIATRVEPVADLAWARVPPVTVPCWANMGLRETTVEWFGSWWAGTQARSSTNTSTATTAAVTGANGGGVTSGSNSDGSDTGKKTGRVGSDEDEKGQVMKKQVNGKNSNTTDNNTDTRNNNDVDEEEEEEEDDDDDVDDMDATTQAEQAAAEAAGLGDAFCHTRLDFGLQVSSTMEEVSTSWSAIKSHTEYWGNRDLMLLMVSQMLKSSNADMLASCQDKVKTLAIVNEKAAVERMTEATAQQRTRSETEQEALGVSVAKQVDRIVDEAVATYELVRQHPGVRVEAWGGVGQKAMLDGNGIAEGKGGGEGIAMMMKKNHDKRRSVGKKSGGRPDSISYEDVDLKIKMKQTAGTGAGTEKEKGDGDAGDGEEQTDTTVNGWASYLSRGWFGASGGGGGEESNGVATKTTGAANGPS